MEVPSRRPSALDPARALSTLQLLRAPHVFSQAGLWTEAQMVREAKTRGVDVDVDKLELLHRRRLLVPLFKVHATPVAKPMRRLPQPDWSSAARQVWHAALEGRLTDPAAHAFRRWPRSHDRRLYLYSPFQTLALRHIRFDLYRLSATRQGRDIRWDLPVPEHHQLKRAARDRALAVGLEVLAPRYLPRVMRSVRWSGPDGGKPIMDLSSDHDPRFEEKLLHLSGEVAMHCAEMILGEAGFFDPMGKWSRVVRVGNPGRWQELRFDALLAHEHRVAAEMLLLYQADLVQQGRAPEPPDLSTTWHERRHDRLHIDATERSETLLDFRLHDRPAVVLAVEGKTELTVAPRVLELYGVTEDSGRVLVIDRKGIYSDHRLLARAVGIPRLDPDGYRGARLRAAATGLVLAVDPEGPSATAADRERQRDEMVQEILEALPPDAQADEVRSDLRYMVRVHAWGDETFEFAHFSDHELGTALRRLCAPGCPSLAKIKDSLKHCRTAKSNIDNMWKRWPTQPSKPGLADELWPGLERRIVSGSSRRPVPIADVVEDILGLVDDTRRVRELGPRPSP